MALQGSITGINQLYFGSQGVLTANFIDSETGQTPTGLQYAWRASAGSFVGATDTASVTYRADPAQNADQTVTITCDVTLPGNPNPTVSAPSLTAMTELGITGTLVNMLITAEISGSELFDRTDNTAIHADSDALIDTDMRVNRLRWTGSSLILNKASGGTQFRNWWNGDRRDAYSAFIIINDGTVVELPGTWIALGSGIGGNFMRWDVPSTETDIRDALDTIATEQLFLFGIADTGSIGLPDVTASADAAVNVQRNEPPVVSITAPARLNPGESAQIDISITDPENTNTTIRLETTDGTIDNPTSTSTRITAPNTPGPITITATATDAQGIQGSTTHVVVINSPPTVTITAPSRLEVGRTGNVSIAVSDPNSDPVTLLIEISAGTIDNPTALNAIITAPDTPQTITLTVTATDSEGLETVETAQIAIVTNQPPTLNITVPNALEIGQTGNLRATVGDPTNDPVTIRWEASAGAIGNRTALNTTITVPVMPQTITVTCIATDDRGAMTTKTATITVRQPNRPPTVTLNVPAQADPGQTVRVEAVVTDQDGDNTEGEWRAPKGQIANPENKVTTITLPNETGIVPVTYEAMDDMGATSEATAYITVGNPKANIYTPAVRIEIEGVDVTDRRIPRDGLTVGKSLDYPELLTFRSAGISFNLDNKDGVFDYSNPNNFFIAQGLPAHGRGAKVLVRIGLSQSELIPVFAGEISEVITSLRNTKAQIKARDLSVRSRQKVIENFGIEITRPITDYEGAAVDYTEFDPVFYFPIWGLPISRNSVSLIVHHSDGNDIDISIVDAIKTEGMLSNRNAEIDYARGLIRFEAEPDDGAQTRITATWKRDYRYKRPDFLTRQLLKNTGIQDTVGITDDTTARFAIEQARLRHPTDPVFSSHGRPFFQQEGIVRWIKQNPSTDKWLMSIDTRLVEYDEYQDEYTQITEHDRVNVSENAIPPGTYGELIPSEGIDLNTLAGITQPGFTIHINRIYLASPVIDRFSFDQTPWYNVDAYGLDGERLTNERLVKTFSYVLSDIAVYDNTLYVLHAGGAGTNRNTFRISRYLLSDYSLVDSPSISSSTAIRIRSFAVTPTRIYVLARHSSQSDVVRVYDLEFNRLSTEDWIYPNNFDSSAKVSASATHLYISKNSNIEAFTLDGTRAEHLDLTPANGWLNFEVVGDRMYVYNTARNIDVYRLSVSNSYENLVMSQFDTADYNNFYVLGSNTLKADILSDPTFSSNLVSKYNRTTDTWSVVLDRNNGAPQIAHPYDFPNENKLLLDNRKNFKVISYNNKTLIFYRRAEPTQSSICLFNETDDIFTDITTESHTGLHNSGVPYSMDFWTDERSDGIYVYSFVVRYTFTGTSFTSATLKVYRRRVEPLGTETEIFSETFTGTGGDDLYPVSVSDIILSENRNKFYFVLDYQNEADDMVGKAELCEIAKDGTGSRSVLKVYRNPLLGPRSPASVNNRYFYLEGGWVRLPKSDPADDALLDDEHHYPNKAGHLIEIESNGDITDHGIVWRSRSKLDSPDPDPDNPQYDGWGLHNAIVSNMAVDSRDNLRFIAGYGLPYRINNNLPSASITGAIPDESNFVWIQFGQDLSTKIASFPTNGKRGWELIQQLAQLMNWEIGFNPAMGKVDAVQSTDSSISDWSANGSFFFRPRTILPAKLRTAITASGSLSSIVLNDSGLPAEASEFPIPPSRERYAVIVDRELFTYTGTSSDAQGRTLTGVSRAQNGSTAQAHSVDAAVYFVDYFASGEQGTTLVSIQNRSQDFVNLKNDVNVGFGDRVYPTKKQRSIDEHGEKTFNLGTSQPLLSRQDRIWAELIGETYLDELSDLKEALQFTLVFSPMLQSGQLLVLYQLDRVRIEFKLFKLVRVQQHTDPRWQTGVTALEIIPEGVPVRWLTVPRQTLRYNQSLNLDLKNYVAGTLPIQIQASGLPSGFSISNGVISGSTNMTGEHTISLTATNRDGEATTTFEVLVGEPRWPSIPVQTGTEDTFFYFDWSSYTPEGITPITYQLGGSAPSWITFREASQDLYGTPPDATGDQTYIIPIVATNEIGSDTVNIILTVEDTI